MGNSLLKCFRADCWEDESTLPHEPQSLGPHGVTPPTIGLTALAQDLFNFELTSQVPEGLSLHVVSSRKAQARWYKKLSEAWREARPTPKSPEAAAALVVQTLIRNQRADVEGLLAYYSLPLPPPSFETAGTSSSLPEGVLFEFHTLPVNEKAVTDGDGITVYVDTADPRESASVPREVHEAAIERTRARAAKNYARADAMQKSITNAGYRIINGPNGENTLARKYRIRLRGIDAPESSMPYGKEAKDQLIRLVQGKSLKIHSYGDDQYGRCIGDVYCNGAFVQEQMLRRGFAWHYVAYDQRPEFAKWEKEARSARRGLWASSDPEKPWEWRKRNDGWREGNVPIQVY